MRVLAALRRAWSPSPALKARLHHALTMEKLWIEGEALGLTPENLARIEAAALGHARAGGSTLSVPMRWAIDGFRCYGHRPPPPRDTAEAFGVLAAHLRHTGRLVLIDVFSRLAPAASSDLKESRHGC